MRIRFLREVFACAGLALTGLVPGTAGTPARAGEVVLQIGTYINGTTPASPAPWITLDFKDTGAPGSGTVQLTITNHLPSTEFTDDILFNSKVGLTAANIAFVSGNQDSSITTSTNGQNNIKAGVFDVNMNYPTSNNDPNRFFGGETAVYNISAPGLSASSFYELSTADRFLKGGPYFAAAHIQGLSGGGSFSGGTVPEPSTLTLGALGIVGVLVARRLRRRQARA